MKVDLLHNTPLWVTANAIRTCWQSQDKSDTEFDDFGNPYWLDENINGICTEYPGIGPKDQALIDRVGNKFKHASTLEHVTYNFYVSGISRALLQELARHRMANLSVKSTRYTLKELKDEEAFTSYTDLDSQEYINNGRERAEKYIVLSSDERVNRMSILALDNLRELLVQGISNDQAKYALPESYKTELTWTINIRSLQNFISLRSNKAALWEIRDLAKAVYDALPKEHKFLFEDCLNSEEH